MNRKEYTTYIKEERSIIIILSFTYNEIDIFLIIF